MPRIVVLDGQSLNPGDLDWAPIARLGDLTLHPGTPATDTLDRLRNADIALTNKVVLDDARMAALPSLRYIGILATGANVVDLPAARRRGITVTNAPGYSGPSVAQHAIALLLTLTNAPLAHRPALPESWPPCVGFRQYAPATVELSGLTMGIVGMGDIGKRVATLAAALGMSIAAAEQRSMASVSLPGIDIRWMPLDDLFAAADVLSLHCPLNERTERLVNAARLARMKPTACLINTSRGGLIDESALVEALRAGRLAGAGLDVLSTEPPPADHPLLREPRCLVTPHIAWASRAARQRLMDIVAANLSAFLDGKPINVVS